MQTCLIQVFPYRYNLLWKFLACQSPQSLVHVIPFRNMYTFFPTYNLHLLDSAIKRDAEVLNYELHLSVNVSFHCFSLASCSYHEHIHVEWIIILLNGNCSSQGKHRCSKLHLSRTLLYFCFTHVLILSDFILGSLRTIILHVAYMSLNNSSNISMKYIYLHWGDT